MNTNDNVRGCRELPALPAIPICESRSKNPRRNRICRDDLIGIPGHAESGTGQVGVRHRGEVGWINGYGGRRIRRTGRNQKIRPVATPLISWMRKGAVGVESCPVVQLALLFVMVFQVKEVITPFICPEASASA